MRLHIERPLCHAWRAEDPVSYKLQATSYKLQVTGYGERAVSGGRETDRITPTLPAGVRHAPA